MSNSALRAVKLWRDFSKLTNVIKHESRFVLQEPHKSFVNSITQMIRDQFTSVIPANSILYRARINTINFENRDNEKIPSPPEEMGPPDHHLAISGRINPEGIPYLYCAGELDTAGAELRPWKDAYLTIAEVTIKSDITLADLTLNCKDDVWDMFFDDFAEMFSRQWPPELKLNYLVTQYFSEHLKAEGFRGIKYKSDFNDDGNNYSLFYKEDYDINKTYIVSTSVISYYFYKNKNV